MRNVTEIQRELIRLGFLAPVNDKGEPNDDGKFGAVSMDAYNHFLASNGKPKHEGLILLTELNAELFPDELPAPKPAKPISQLALIGALFNLLKGNNMTSDQITGIIRLVLGIASGLLVSRGIATAGVMEWISAGVLAAIPAVWSWLNNRPKTITKMGP